MDPKNKDKNAADSSKKQETQTADVTKTENAPASLKSYSKYDFVPGEKIIVFEDFAQDAVGDFPDKWNTNASAEIVTIESLQGKWLKISKQGYLCRSLLIRCPTISHLNMICFAIIPERFGLFTPPLVRFQTGIILMHGNHQTAGLRLQ
jgi:hypothetical protein